MIETIDLVLTGARAGQTCVLNGKQFTKGVLRLRGSRDQLEPVTSYYGRTYHAFPNGSKELKEAQARDHGDNKANSASQSGTANGVQRAGANDHAGGNQAADGAAAHSGGVHGVEAGSSRVLPSGSGHADAGLRSGQGAEQQQSDASSDLIKIREAVVSLDPSVDDNWTADGEPAVEAVAHALKDASISRKQIDAAAGDWNRDQARVR